MVIALVICAVLITVVLPLAAWALFGHEDYAVVEYDARRRMREIRRQTVQRIFEAEARYRQQHGDVIEGTAEELS